VLVLRLALDVAAIRLHVPGRALIGKLHVQDQPQLLAQLGVFDGCMNLDAALEVATHHVRRTDEILLLTAVAEVEDAAVLEEAAGAATDPRVGGLAERAVADLRPFAVLRPPTGRPEASS
jgi:hypothetical protein